MCLLFNLPLVGRSNVAEGKVRVGVVLSTIKSIICVWRTIPPPEADFIAFDLPTRGRWEQGQFPHAIARQ